MNKLIVLLFLLTGPLFGDDGGKIWLVRCVHVSDSQALSSRLQDRAINVLNLVEKRESGAKPLCSKDDFLQAILIWETDKNQAREVEPQLQIPPDGFSMDLPKRIH